MSTDASVMVPPAAGGEADALRRLGLIGLWGAPLTVVILAASALLRLATQFEGGEAVSTLSANFEQAARMAHRLAAAGVGLLAAWAFITAYRARPVAKPVLAAVGAIVGLTLLLAVIGRYTAGYRVMPVIAMNVAGGTALACAFWFLRERAAKPRGALAALPLAALGGIVALSAVGAATSASAMHGDRAFGPAHLWLASLLAAAAILAALRHRRCGLAAAATAVLVAGQYGLGFALLASGRPLHLTLLHSAVSVLLALSLVSLAVRGGADAPARTPAPRA